MLVFLSKWLLLLSIATSSLVDQTLFPPLGIRYVTIPRILIAGWMATVWIRLLSDRQIKSALKAVINDIPSALIFIGVVGLIVWQCVCNLISAYPVSGFLPHQLQWLEMAVIFITALFAAKAGYFRNIIPLAICAVIGSQVFNLAFALWEIFSFIVAKNGAEALYASGTMWYPQGFAVYCIMILPVLWAALRSPQFNTKARKAFLFFLIIATCFTVSVSGSRTGTACLLGALVLWHLLLPRRAVLAVSATSLAGFILGVSFASGVIPGTFGTTPGTSGTTIRRARCIILDNPSTSARLKLLATDVSIASKNLLAGIGMGTDNYKIHASKEPYFRDFETIDPFVAEKPFSHSGTIGNLVTSGLPAFSLFLVMTFGLIFILWRATVWGQNDNLNKSFLCSFLVFQCGFFAHPLYGEGFYMIPIVGLLIAHSSMPRQTAVFSILPLMKATLSDTLSAGLNIIWALRKFFAPKAQVEAKDINSITFLGLLGVGDWLVVLPVLAGLKKKFPAARIAVLTNRLGEQTLELSGLEKTIVLLPDSPRGFRKFIRIMFWLVRNRKKLRSELLICPWWDSTHQFLSCLLPFKSFYGFFSCREGSVSQTRNIAQRLESNILTAKKTYKETEWFGNISKILISGLGSHVPEMRLGHESKKWPREKLCQTGSLLITCQPVCLFENKSWPIEKWLETLVGIGKESKASVVLIGSGNDRLSCRKLHEDLMKNKIEVLNLCGQTSIAELAEVLKASDLFLGTDSGPAHLTSSVGTQAVVLYGPTSPKTYRPVGFKGTAIYEKIECSPCGISYCLLSKKQRCLCMRRIQADEVVQAALKLLR